MVEFSKRWMNQRFAKYAGRISKGGLSACEEAVESVKDRYKNNLLLLLIRKASNELLQ